MMSSIYSLPSARDKVSRFEEREERKKKGKKDHEKGGKKSNREKTRE